MESTSKLSLATDDGWVDHSHPPTFARRSMKSGGERLIVGVPGGHGDVLLSLVACLEEPLYLLYVLHTPRGEGDPGRYQSAALSHEGTRSFLKQFATYLSSDSRFDIWAHSRGSDATVVWDRHNLIYAYGPLDHYERTLNGLGFTRGDPEIPPRHVHHYRPEFDSDAKAILKALDWTRKDLWPEDVQ